MKGIDIFGLRISLCLISSFAFLVYKLVQKLILGRQQTASIWDENYKNGEMSSSEGNSAEMLNSQLGYDKFRTKILVIFMHGNLSHPTNSKYFQF